MTGKDRGRLRATFDEAAELYDRVRPRYPPALFEDLAGLAGLGPGSRVLEIGPGTGQATAPLAERGCRVVAVELGAGLAARRPAQPRPLPARRGGHGRLRGLAAPERAVRPGPGRDRVPLGRPGGAGRQGRRRAPARRHARHRHHPSRHRRRQGILRRGAAGHVRWDPDTPHDGAPLRAAADIPASGDELERSGRFGPATFRRYEWELPYTTSSYIDLLLTYSGHRALDPAAQAGLLDCIASLIDTGYGGRITKRYLAELRVASTPER